MRGLLGLAALLAAAQLARACTRVFYAYDDGTVLGTVRTMDWWVHVQALLVRGLAQQAFQGWT